jgi:hypothetical protein
MAVNLYVTVSKVYVINNIRCTQLKNIRNATVKLNRISDNVELRIRFTTDRDHQTTPPRSTSMIAQTKSHQSFPQFDKLPFELRSLIWLFAARIPRDIEITQYAHCSTPALLYPCRESHAHCSDITTKIAGRTPALLHTCRESRAKALDIYDKFGLEYRKSVLRKPVLRRKVIIYFNPCTDVIYFKSEPHFNHIEPFRPLPTTISPHIRYMKLDTRWIRDTQTDLDQIGFI